MNIHILVIPESEQRPEVNGADWFWDTNGDLQVRVSPLSDWRREVLLGIHEAVEAVMCKHNGVAQASVDVFDQEYDKNHAFDLNAGDDPAAPYVREHCLATAIERILCAELDVNWLSYDTELAQSYPGPSKKS
jgi:hypothetical protein